MSNVSLSIGGRNFTVSCADGEEAHVARLGRLIDQKVAAAGLPGQSETMMLLFAALLLADDLHGAPATGGSSAALAEKLGAIAARVENIADLLESGLESTGANA